MKSTFGEAMRIVFAISLMLSLYYLLGQHLADALSANVLRALDHLGR